VILAALVAFIVVPDDAIQVSIVSIFLQSLYPLTSVKVYKKKTTGNSGARLNIDYPSNVYVFNLSFCLHFKTLVGLPRFLYPYNFFGNVNDPSA